MGEEAKDGGTVTEMAKAVAAVAKEVPLYQHVMQPAAQELGRGLVVVAKTVNAALVPLRAFVWGMEQIEGFVQTRVAKKLENVPAEDIQTPKPHVAVPAIEALRYTGAEESLSDLYANLLATSMDKATASRAHPAFVDIIKNMCPDEARLMKHLAPFPPMAIVNIKSVAREGGGFVIVHRHVTMLGVHARCEHPDLTATYLDNLERLGLIHVDFVAFLTKQDAYSEIENRAEIQAEMKRINEMLGRKAELDKGRVLVTDLGRQFIQTCVLNKEGQPRG